MTNTVAFLNCWHYDVIWLWSVISNISFKHAILDSPCLCDFDEGDIRSERLFSHTTQWITKDRRLRGYFNNLFSLELEDDNDQWWWRFQLLVVIMMISDDDCWWRWWWKGEKRVWGGWDHSSRLSKLDISPSFFFHTLTLIFLTFHFSRTFTFNFFLFLK